MRSISNLILSSMALVALVSCTAGSGGGGGGGGGSGDGTGTCDPQAPTCAEGLVCDVLVSGEARCVSPLLIRGMVLDAINENPIAGALVQAVDANGAAVGTSAATDADGTFTLTVLAVRDEDDTPVEGSYTLRAQAAGFQEFPTAIRPALPLDADTAAMEENNWVIENPLTTVKLIPLPGDTSDLGSISGTIQAERNAGVLVVAEGGGAALTGFSDSAGSYTIFNVPAGAYTVQGYAAGVQLNPATTSLVASEQKTGVDLAESERPPSTVSGNVQIVNAPGGSVTSVVLAVESTFVEAAGRGKVPPGLRVGNVAGAFTIEEVPDGWYVVLAAFENDGLVRDPDQTIGGTRIVRIEVPDPDMGNTVTLPEGFKVTEALAVIAPGAEGPQEVSTSAPDFEWQDDSSEDGYEVRVFDAFGTEVWRDESGSVSGSATVTHAYAGPSLEVGMFYQFRATSFRERNAERTAISSTEDLRGVFVYLGSESTPSANFSDRLLARRPETNAPSRAFVRYAIILASPPRVVGLRRSATRGASRSGSVMTNSISAVTCRCTSGLPGLESWCYFPMPTGIHPKASSASFLLSFPERRSAGRRGSTGKAPILPPELEQVRRTRSQRRDPGNALPTTGMGQLLLRQAPSACRQGPSSPGGRHWIATRLHTRRTSDLGGAGRHPRSAQAHQRSQNANEGIVRAAGEERWTVAGRPELRSSFESQPRL